LNSSKRNGKLTPEPCSFFSAWPARAGAPAMPRKFSGDMVTASSTSRLTMTPLFRSKYSTSGLTPALAAARADCSSWPRLMYSSVPLPGMRSTYCSP
jgi:hypothetical protein